MTTRALVAAIVCPCVFCLPCCTSNSNRAPDGAIAEGARHIVVDGNTADWPAGQASCANEEYLFLRFFVPGGLEALQASHHPVSLLLDVDASTQTGFVSNLAPMNQLGVDLEIQFSPPQADGSPGKGARISSIDASGTRSPIACEDLDLVFAPTYASAWYEVRISRVPRRTLSLPERGLQTDGNLAWMATFSSSDGTIEGYSDPAPLALSTVARKPQCQDSILPPAPSGAFRVVSWNIEKSHPVQDPEPFGRILKALQPDILLMQEWELGTDVEVTQWLKSNVGGEWNVRKAKGDMAHGGGVLVASRWLLSPVLGDSLAATFKDDSGKSQRYPVRYVGARITTPFGDVLAGSLHLKSGGSLDSIEDKRRYAEAKAINATFRAVGDATAVPMRIIGGDFNLVGSRPPLDLARQGLDADGSDLTAADTPVFADSAYYTWRDGTTPFSPGRLDWLLYSDSTMSSAQAFAFDCQRLSDSALAKMGISRSDAGCSDHMPLVMDFLPTKSGPNLR